jgi:hypothetical protein
MSCFVSAIRRPVHTYSCTTCKRDILAVSWSMLIDLLWYKVKVVGIGLSVQGLNPLEISIS